MADACEACEKLREESIDTLRKGITETQCNHLQKDEGLSGKNDDCEDLNTLNDCFIQGLNDKIDLTDDCDWKKYAKAENTNRYWMFQALICVICGLWNNIHDLWKEIEKIWKKIAEIDDEIKNLWLNVNNIWAAIRILQQEDIKIWDAIKLLKEEDISIWQAINALVQSDITINNKITNINNVIDVINRDVGNLKTDVGNLKTEDNKLWDAIRKINNSLPGGFSTLVTKEIWRGNGLAGQNLRLSESAMNFDAIRVSFNVGGAQYSVDIQPGYFQHDAQNIATYSGIDFSGTTKFESSAGLRATDAAMGTLNVVPGKANLVWTNLTNGNIERFSQGTDCNNQIGQCIISRIEGVKKINY